MHVHMEVSGDVWMGEGDAASSGSMKINLWGLSESTDSGPFPCSGAPIEQIMKKWCHKVVYFKWYKSTN